MKNVSAKESKGKKFKMANQRTYDNLMCLTFNVMITQISCSLSRDGQSRALQLFLLLIYVISNHFVHHMNLTTDSTEILKCQTRDF